jgi:hypothetical protein
MSEDAALAKWGTVGFEVPPPFMEPIVDVINTFLEMLVVLLDIVMVILQVVKVFVIGLLSPIIPILELIIAMLEGILGDLRNAGLYVRGDWTALEAQVSAQGGARSLNPKIAGLKGWDGMLRQFMGGYGRYEGRVVNWLTDGSDPNRPDFSSASGVLGMFFVGGAGIYDIVKLWKAIKTIAKLFGQMNFDGSALMPAVGLDVRYQTQGGAAGAFVDMAAIWKETDAPQEAVLEWKFGSPPGADPALMVFPPLPPEGCLVEVSTIPGGLFVGYTAPSETAAAKAAPGFSTDVSRRYGMFRVSKTFGGGPLMLYGGPDAINCYKGVIAGGYRQNPAGMDFPPKSGNNWETSAFALTSPSDANPISIKKWKDAVKEGGQHILQRTFVVDTRSMAGMFSGFGLTLKAEHMPYPLKEVKDGKPVAGKEPAKEVYVRVTPISGEGLDYYGATTKRKEGSQAQDVQVADGKGVQWRLGSATDLNSATIWPTQDDRGPTSQPAKVSFPSGTMLGFAQAVKAAFYVAVLVRADLSSAGGSEKWGGKEYQTGLEGVSDAVAAYLMQFVSAESWYTGGQWGDFSFIVRSAANRFVSDFMRLGSAIPDSALSALMEAYGNTLIDPAEGAKIELGGYSIPTGSILGGGSTERNTIIGLMEPPLLSTFEWCKNAGTAGPSIAKSRLAAAAQTGMGLGNVRTPPGAKKSTVPTSLPCLQLVKGTTAAALAVMETYDSSGIPAKKKMELIKAGGGAISEGEIVIVPARNLFTDDQLKAAAGIMNIAARPVSNGEWIAIRPLEGLLAPVEEFLEKIIATVKSIRDGLLALLEEILKYIRMIEMRVMELQQFIRKIQAILAMFKDFEISGDLAFLMVTSAGTDGLVADFLSAEEKPDIGSTDYAIGGCVVAGGLPLLLLELIQVIMAAAEEEEEEA